MRPIEHAADPMERTCSVHSNFRSDPIGHGHGHGQGHGKTEPVQGHTLAADARGACHVLREDLLENEAQLGDRAPAV